MSQVNWIELLGWGEDQIEDLRFVGYSYIKQGKYDIALSFFEALTVLDPDSLYDNQILGGLYLETGNHLAALDLLERAIKTDGSHAPTLLNRIKAMIGLGYKKQALSQAQVLVDNPDTSIANEAEAIILAYS